MCMFPASCFCQRTYKALGLVKGVFNETWTNLCLQFDLNSKQVRVSVGVDVVMTTKEKEKWKKENKE